MKEATISLQIALLLHTQPKLVVKLTGHHMMIVYNLNLRTFSTGRIRCQRET